MVRPAPGAAPAARVPVLVVWRCALLQVRRSGSPASPSRSRSGAGVRPRARGVWLALEAVPGALDVAGRRPRRRSRSPRCRARSSGAGAGCWRPRPRRCSRCRSRSCPARWRARGAAVRGWRSRQPGGGRRRGLPALLRHGGAGRRLAAVGQLGQVEGSVRALMHPIDGWLLAARAWRSWLRAALAAGGAGSRPRRHGRARLVCGRRGRGRPGRGRAGRRSTLRAGMRRPGRSSEQVFSQRRAGRAAGGSSTSTCSTSCAPTGSGRRATRPEPGEAASAGAFFAARAAELGRAAVPAVRRGEGRQPAADPGGVAAAVGDRRARRRASRSRRSSTPCAQPGALLPVHLRPDRAGAQLRRRVRGAQLAARPRSRRAWRSAATHNHFVDACRGVARGTATRRSRRTRSSGGSGTAACCIRCYGFERMMFRSELGPGEVIGWGLADGVFFERMVPPLARERAAVLRVPHHARPAPPVRPLPRPPQGARRRRAQGHAARQLHPRDALLRRLAGGVHRARSSARACSRNTVVALYGDHEAGLCVDEPRAGAGRREAAGTPSVLVRLRRVPFFVLLPGSPLAGEVPVIGGQVDIAPTLLALLGVPSPACFVGRALDPGRDRRSRCSTTARRWATGCVFVADGPMIPDGGRVLRLARRRSRGRSRSAGDARAARGAQELAASRFVVDARPGRDDRGAAPSP